jgi:hippurate hydrolase
VHAARPHEGRDALLAASATIVALQSVVSSALDPGKTAVLSCTELIANGTRNVIAGEARVLGDCRSFDSEVSTAIEQELRNIADGCAAAHGCAVHVSYAREFIPLINDPDATQAAVKAARTVLGAAAVSDDAAPITASEDFARLLQRVPGCFVLLGNGPSQPLHNPAYDFCDEALPPGVRFLAELARQRLPVAS